MTQKRKASVPQVTRSAEPLYQEIRAVLESARAGAYRAVNAAMVQAYWQVGRLIVEHEQKGRRRAGYGEAVIATLAERLTQDLGRGFNERNLWYMRSFHLAFPILNALRSESHPSTSDDTLVPAQRLPATLRPELSWTHYRLLLRVEDPQARDWYLNEAAEQHWSTRQLERQISVLYQRAASGQPQESSRPQGSRHQAGHGRGGALHP